MVSNETYAREDADLYRLILAQLGASTEIIVNDEYLLPLASGDERAVITIATPEMLASAGGREAAIITRLSPQATKRIGRSLPGTAMLPDR